MKNAPQKAPTSKINPNSKKIQKKPKDFKKKNDKKFKKNNKEQQAEETPNVQFSGIEALFQKAKKIYEEVPRDYEKQILNSFFLQREKQFVEKKGSRGDLQLMKKIMDSGTLADKVSALSIRIRDHPKFPIDSLVRLLAFVIAPFWE